MEMMRGSDVAAPTDIENPETLKIDLGNFSPMSPSRCIYRVPDRFRRVREKDYTPRVISIGPFHHRNEALKPMEVHKRWYLKCFMERSQRTHSNLNDDYNRYIGTIRKQEKELRNCYAETIVLSSESSDQFVRMILVDAIFLIEFLLRYRRYVLGLPPDENDCIFGRPLLLPDVRADLLMLENQLPLFILEDLFSLYDPESRGEVKKLSIQFLIDQDLMGFGVKLSLLHVFSYQVEGEDFVEGKHFVDLLRNLSAMDQRQKKTKSKIAPTIEKLNLAGVNFQAKSSPNLFDISFHKTKIMRNGVLEIPRLKIVDSTELILRNLIAFEQCIICEDPIISHYVILMDMLVNRPKDAELLCENEIVENHLLGDDNELASMINRLSTGIDYDLDDFYYGTLCNDLEKFCSENWHKFWANLRRKYFNFNTPWTIISVVAAVILLILTFIQTFCSIYLST